MNIKHKRDFLSRFVAATTNPFARRVFVIDTSLQILILLAEIHSSDTRSRMRIVVAISHEKWNRSSVRSFDIVFRNKRVAVKRSRQHDLNNWITLGRSNPNQCLVAFGIRESVVDAFRSARHFRIVSLPRTPNQRLLQMLWLRERVRRDIGDVAVVIS